MVIDLEARQGDKGQAMFLEHPKEENFKDISLDEFEKCLMKIVQEHGQPDRLNPEDVNICKASKELRDNPGAQEYFNNVLTRNPMPNINVCDSQNTTNK